MLLLLFMLRKTKYFRYVSAFVLLIILFKLATYSSQEVNDDNEHFTGFKSKKEKYAYCDTVEQVGKFCKKNKSQLCKEYKDSLKETKKKLNKVLLQAEGFSFDGPATSNKKPKI